MPRAVLIGANYLGAEYALAGCINDTKLLRFMLTTIYGYKADDILVLTDLTTHKPTRANILASVAWLYSKKKASEFEGEDELTQQVRSEERSLTNLKILAPMGSVLVPLEAPLSLVGKLGVPGSRFLSAVEELVESVTEETEEIGTLSSAPVLPEITTSLVHELVKKILSLIDELRRLLEGNSNPSALAIVNALDNLHLENISFLPDILQTIPVDPLALVDGKINVDLLDNIMQGIPTPSVLSDVAVPLDVPLAVEVHSAPLDVEVPQVPIEVPQVPIDVPQIPIDVEVPIDVPQIPIELHPLDVPQVPIEVHPLPIDVPQIPLDVEVPIEVHPVPLDVPFELHPDFYLINHLDEFHQQVPTPVNTMNVVPGLPFFNSGDKSQGIPVVNSLEGLTAMITSLTSTLSVLQSNLPQLMALQGALQGIASVSNSSVKEAPPSARQQQKNIHLSLDPAENERYFFGFSGHGTQIKDENGDEIDGMDEVICPLDFEKNGPITDDTLHHILTNALPKSSRLSMVFDCCNSGSAMDLPVQLKKSFFGRIKQTSGDDLECGFVTLLSGCKDDQTSADVSRNGQNFGACTHALTQVLRSNPSETYRTLETSVRKFIQSKGYSSQEPVLSFSKHTDISDVVKF